MSETTATPSVPAAIELLLPDGQPSGVYVCPHCRHFGADREYIASHCVCKRCSSVLDRKKPVWNSGCCESCEMVRQREREAQRWAKATILDDWDGWVWHDGASRNNGYFESLEDYVEWLEEERESTADWPELVWIAEPQPYPQLDADTILENAYYDELGSDFEDGLEGIEKLRAAVDAFRKANAGKVSYYAHQKKAVRVPKPEVVG